MKSPCDMVCQERGQSTEDVFHHLMSKYGSLQMIMVILPNKGADSGYGETNSNKSFQQTQFESTHLHNPPPLEKVVDNL